MTKFKTITINTPKLFSFQETLSFLDRGYDECLYKLSDDTVSKLVNFSDGKGILKIYQKGDSLKIELQKSKISTSNLQEVSNYVTEWFDLTRNIAPFYRLLDKHKELSYFTKEYFGSRIISIPNLFEALC